LNSQELGGFLVLADEIIYADGVYRDEEKEALHLLKKSVSIDDEDTPRLSGTEARNLIRSYRSRVICLIELTGLAYVDSDFCQAEQEYLKALAEYWGIDPEASDQIVYNVASLANINDELMHLMAKED
jgi:uncharacterized tellurite resistance protein B-like protein